MGSYGHGIPTVCRSLVVVGWTQKVMKGELVTVSPLCAGGYSDVVLAGGSIIVLKDTEGYE